MSDFQWLENALAPEADDLKYAERMRILGPKILDVIKMASMIDQCQSAQARRALDIHLREALTALQACHTEIGQQQ
jgi:hypothetical protein